MYSPKFLAEWAKDRTDINLPTSNMARDPSDYDKLLCEWCHANGQDVLVVPLVSISGLTSPMARANHRRERRQLPDVLRYQRCGTEECKIIQIQSSAAGRQSHHKGDGGMDGEDGYAVAEDEGGAA